MTTQAWIRDKAQALATGWQWLYGTMPSTRTVALALAAAWHETRCGDAWPNEHNWGACTLRRLTDQEQSVLVHAGLHPTVGASHAQIEREAQAALEASGLPLPHGVIHCDSTTDAKGQHPYFVFFAAFDTDAEGARYYLSLLAGESRPKAARAVLLDPKGTVRQVAQAMYYAGYYWGFHPHDHGDGDRANINDYATALESLWPSIEKALQGWLPAVAPAPPVRDLRLGDSGPDVRTMQGIVGATQDSKFGPNTLAKVNAWRIEHGMLPNGTWDAQCRVLAAGAPSAEMPRLALIPFGEWRSAIDEQIEQESLAEDLEDEQNG